MSRVLNKPEGTIWSQIPYIFLFIGSLALIIWLIVLGIGLLKMKRWARRGSVIYGRIQIVFIAIVLAAIIISSIQDWENAHGLLMRSMTLRNGMVLVQSIYMILLLVFMQSKKVKRAFAPIGG